MKYRSIADMSHVITRNLHRVPADIDLVVGVPRSGILPAITISLLLNLRYCDLDAYLDGRLAGAGSTKVHSGLIGKTSDARHVLVVDDSLNRGDAMREAREKLAGCGHGVTFTFAAIYVVPDGRGEVDIAFELLPLPRMFEWNFIHHPYLPQTCVEIDGVLCHGPLKGENDDGPEYVRFLAAASPLYRPTRRIGCLVTSRLERYRPQTEAWLERHGIAYDKLVMLDLPSAEQRRQHGVQEQFKGEVYRDSKAMLFIESGHDQAVTIAKIAGKPVLLIERHEIVSPDAWAATTAMQKLRNFSRDAQMADSPLVSRGALARRMRNVLPAPVYQAIKAMASKARTVLPVQKS